jgi:hypothetical protein
LGLGGSDGVDGLDGGNGVDGEDGGDGVDGDDGEDGGVVARTGSVIFFVILQEI